MEWLLEGEPWVEYRTRLDLLEQSENEIEVINKLLKLPYFHGLIEDVVEVKFVYLQEKTFNKLEKIWDMLK